MQSYNFFPLTLSMSIKATNFAITKISSPMKPLPEFLTERITAAVKKFIKDEDKYSDNVQLAVNTEDYSVEIADPDDDLPVFDYYPMMELVNVSESGWTPDAEAIASVVDEYVL